MSAPRRPSAQASSTPGFPAQGLSASAGYRQGREADDGLDELDFSGAERRERGSKPRSSNAGHPPSVVIAPHAERADVRVQARSKRGQEPTLVIRDRDQIREIRAHVKRAARRNAAGRRARVLLWGGAGLLSFAFGAGLVSLLGAGMSRASGWRSVDGASLDERVSPPAAATLSRPSRPAVSAAVTVERVGPGDGHVATARAETASRRDVDSVSGTRTGLKEPASTKALLPVPPERRGNVVSLDELPSE